LATRSVIVNDGRQASRPTPSNTLNSFFERSKILYFEFLVHIYYLSVLMPTLCSQRARAADGSSGSVLGARPGEAGVQR
jgi:hypothetical protein